MSNKNTNPTWSGRERAACGFGLGFVFTGLVGLGSAVDDFRRTEALIDDRAAIHYSEPNEGQRRSTLAQQIETTENRPYIDGAAALGLLLIGSMVLYDVAEKRGAVPLTKPADDLYYVKLGGIYVGVSPLLRPPGTSSGD